MKRPNSKKASAVAQAKDPLERPYVVTLRLSEIEHAAICRMIPIWSPKEPGNVTNALYNLFLYATANNGDAVVRSAKALINWCAEEGMSHDDLVNETQYRISRSFPKRKVARR